MHRAKYVIPVLFALAAILGVTGWWLYRAAQPMELALYFHPFVGSGAAGAQRIALSQSGWRGSFQGARFPVFSQQHPADGRDRRVRRTRQLPPGAIRRRRTRLWHRAARRAAPGLPADRVRHRRGCRRQQVACATRRPGPQRPHGLELGGRLQIRAVRRHTGARKRERSRSSITLDSRRTTGSSRPSCTASHWTAAPRGWISGSTSCACSRVLRPSTWRRYPV